MNPSSSREALNKKGTKLLGRGDREDVILDVIIIEYMGERIHDDVRLAENSYESIFKSISRIDVTDFIDPSSGQVKIPNEFLIKNVTGFKEHVEKYFQKRTIQRISVGLRGDKYRVEWRRGKRDKKEGFARSVLAKVINPENK